MYRPLYLLTALAFLLPVVLAGCARTDATMSPEMQRDAAERTGLPGDMIAGTSASNTIVENARAIAELRSFVAALEAADMVDVLNGPGPYTVFAPTNEAFDIADADDLLARPIADDDRAQLAEVIRSHVVESEIMFADLTDGQILVSLNGEEHPVARESTDLLEKRIGAADIVAYDIDSSNGVLHVINLVLNDEGFFRE